MCSDEYLGSFRLFFFFSFLNQYQVTSQTLVFTHRCPSAPLCAATYGPSGAFDVCSSLADNPAKCGVWIWDAWRVCFHGDRHTPRPSQHWAEGPTYSWTKSPGTGGETNHVKLVSKWMWVLFALCHSKVCCERRTSMPFYLIYLIYLNSLLSSSVR